MIELSKDDRRALTFRDYAQAIGEGRFVSRREMAEQMQVAYSTAMYHLERAVSEGVLNKVYGYVGNQPGWVYATKTTMPIMEGMGYDGQ